MTTDKRKALTYIPDDLEYYPHQIDGVRRLCRMGSAILGDDMGLGKSIQALTVFAVDVEALGAETMLIVCPATLKENWAEEIAEHTLFKEVHVINTWTKPKRSKAILAYKEAAGPKILIVNYEQVGPHLSELNSISWDVIAYDEAHAMKNPRAKRTKSAHGLVGKRHLPLSGSIMLNQVNELWSPLFRVDPAGFPNYYKFVSRYCVFGGFKNKQIVGVKNEKELQEKLAAVMVRRLKEDVLDLPDKQYIPVVVDLHPEQKRLYDLVHNDMLLPSADEASNEDIQNALTMFLRLKQICGTTATIEGYADYSHKLDRAVEIVEELTATGHKVAIFTQFRGVLAAMEQRLSGLAVGSNPYPVWTIHGDIPTPERTPRVRAWTDHDGPGAVLAMHQVGGIGLNMTAARHMIRLDKLFVPLLNTQTEDRLHRIGADKTQPIQIFDLITKGTVEYRVEQINRVKKKLFDTIVDSPLSNRDLYRILKEADES